MSEPDIVRPRARGEVETITPEQVSLIRGRRYNRVKRADGGHGDQKSGGQNDTPNTADTLAAAHGVSPATIKRDGQFPDAIKKRDTPPGSDQDSERDAARKIADETGEPVATVYKRIRRGKEKLQTPVCTAEPSTIPTPSAKLEKLEKQLDEASSTPDQAAEVIEGREEIARILGVSSSTIRVWITSGQISFPVWFTHRHNRMCARRSDVEAYAAVLRAERTRQAEAKAALEADRDRHRARKAERRVKRRAYLESVGSHGRRTPLEPTRNPGCRHYERCLDIHARLDIEGRPMDLIQSARECQGWDCTACTRYEPAGPRDPADIKLLCFVAYLACGVDPSEAFGDVRRHDARVQALPCAE